VNAPMLRPVLAVVLACAVLVACGRGDDTTTAVAGDADRGRTLFSTYGCVACHAIEGVRGADARVGPRLDDLGSQRIIAGVVPNTPEDLARWIMDPPALSPRTAMPNVGVTPEDAADLVAFLYRPE
jgi:cytochrome c